MYNGSPSQTHPTVYDVGTVPFRLGRNAADIEQCRRTVGPDEFEERLALIGKSLLPFCIVFQWVTNICGFDVQ